MHAGRTKCPICAERQHGSARQIYIIHGELGRYVFDISLAKRTVADGRQPCAVPAEALQRFLEVNNEWSEQHLAHVDPDVPGIVGQRFGGMALFDGTHRAERARREGRQFWAYVLTYEESADCLIGQDVAEMNAEIIAREIRGVLRNNYQIAERITVELRLSADEEPGAAEAAIREQLAPEENQKVQLLLKQERRRRGDGAA
jgi:hypothetical protein